MGGLRLSLEARSQRFCRAIPMHGYWREREGSSSAPEMVMHDGESNKG